MNGFYTYVWFRENGTPYYVGKGSKNRAFSGSSHNVKCPPKDRILVFPADSEEEAYETEVDLIWYYGRKDLGTGCLRNKTNGGENPPNVRGIKRSQQTRDKISAALMGNKSTTGQTQSIATKNKKGNSLWSHWRAKRSAELFQKTPPPYIPRYDNFIPGVTPVLYSGPFWGQEEIQAAVEALCKGAWLTSGEYVARFQGRFAQRFHAKHALMVNSGSSANLVMIATLKKRHGWQDGDEVIVSPVGFPTTIAPLVQNGLKPVFVDIEMSTLNFDLKLVEAAITKRTKAIFISPVLGNPPDLNTLVGFGIPLVGDNCDSLGTLWGGQLWTDFCIAWSNSFYPAHHISTGEGGMVCSNDGELIDIARSFANWGRACYCVGAANKLPCGTCGKRFSDWFCDGSVVDHKYIFDNMGYNLKPLDLQGAIGLVQLDKFDEIEQKRRANKAAIGAFFEGDGRVRVAQTEEGSDPSWFGVPLICRNRAVKENLVAHIEANKIQTRPYFAGNLLRHPGYRDLGSAAAFPNADNALDTVFFLGCPPHYNRAILTYIGDVVNAWKK